MYISDAAQRLERAPKKRGVSDKVLDEACGMLPSAALRWLSGFRKHHAHGIGERKGRAARSVRGRQLSGTGSTSKLITRDPRR